MTNQLIARYSESFEHVGYAIVPVDKLFVTDRSI